MYAGSPPPNTRVPIKLGSSQVVVDGGGKKFAYEIPVVTVAPVRWSLGGKIALALTILLIVGVAVVGTLAATMPGGLTGTASADSPNPGNVSDSTPTILPRTDFPTVSGVTFRPTAAPTTSSPTAAPIIGTRRPTLAPTNAPTLTPTLACLSPDATCGCGLTQSEEIDVIFLVDESGSVGQANYDLMKFAIMNFSQDVDPPFNPVNGSRMGLIEFSDVAKEQVELSAASTSAQFNALVNATKYNEGGTNHGAAFKAAEAMLNKTANQPRVNGTLSLVMMTDGNPCVTCNQACKDRKAVFNNFDVNGVPFCCCSDSIAQAGGLVELKHLFTLYDFTLFLFPINPPPGFDDIDISRFEDPTLPADKIVFFPQQSFSELDAFLNGDTFTLPLGQCVEEPVSSRPARKLLLEEAFVPEYLI